MQVSALKNQHPSTSNSEHWNMTQNIMQPIPSDIMLTRCLTLYLCCSFQIKRLQISSTVAGDPAPGAFWQNKSDASKKVIIIPVKKPHPATWTLLKRLPNYIHARGNSPDWRMAWKQAHQTLAVSHTVCQYDIALYIFFMICDTVWNMHHGYILY